MGHQHSSQGKSECDGSTAVRASQNGTPAQQSGQVRMGHQHSSTAVRASQNGTPAQQSGQVRMGHQHSSQGKSEWDTSTAAQQSGQVRMGHQHSSTAVRASQNGIAAQQSGQVSQTSAKRTCAFSLPMTPPRGLSGKVASSRVRDPGSIPSPVIPVATKMASIG